MADVHVADVHVAIAQTADGWTVVTADAFKDPILGPFKSIEMAHDEAVAARLTLDMAGGPNMAPVHNVLHRGVPIRDLKPPAIFRVDAEWYELQGREGQFAILRVLGSPDKVKLPLKTKVTEVSVLSL